MNDTKLRWGILGTANIARKNWQAIRNSGNNIVTAVASRSQDRARAYIDSNQAHAPMGAPVTAHGSYEALIADPRVDAVYIPLPTGLRKEWVLRAAQAGKHVICEKPCGTNVAELREMLGACERNRVQFMDGVMMMHSERLPKVREVLEDGQSIGQLRRMESTFSFCGGDEFLADNIRMNSNLEPDGCLGDLGWYSIRFMLWVMKWRMPDSITGRYLASQGRADSPDRVPTECSAELTWPGGVSGSFYCSFITADQQFMTLSGTRGYLHMPDFVLPFFGSEAGFDVTNSQFNIRGCDFNMEPRVRRVTVNEYSNSMPNAQEANLYRNFANQVRSGRLNTEWPESVLKTQQVMEAVIAAAKRALGAGRKRLGAARLPSAPSWLVAHKCAGGAIECRALPSCALPAVPPEVVGNGCRAATTPPAQRGRSVALPMPLRRWTRRYSSQRDEFHPHKLGMRPFRSSVQQPG